MGFVKSEEAKSLMLKRRMMMMMMTNNIKITGRFGVVGDI